MWKSQPLPRRLPESWSDGRGYTKIEDLKDAQPRRKVSATGKVLVVFCCSACVWALSLLHTARNIAATRNAEAELATSASAHLFDGTSDSSLTNSVQLRVWNAYTRHDTRQNGKQQLYPWEHVAEPYRATTLEVVHWPDHLGDPSSFRWEINGQVEGIGSTLKTLFKSVGQHNCSITAYSEGSDTWGSTDDVPRSDEASGSVTYTFSVMVKYVRREIRALTDRDREMFFNAISVLQRVPSAVGRRIYGSKYYSKDYFTRIHLYYGADQLCDHWHDGAGFVTSHVALTLMFEQSLQSVNPSITVPYWDFTVEGTTLNSTTFRSSGVFADDWFGTATPKNAMRAVDRGRFAYVPAMTNASEYSLLRNSYDMLRAPWNNDPTPFTTRHDHLFGYRNNRKPSGCKQYRDSLNHDTWMSLVISLNSDAHGHVHELMGGTWSTESGAVADRTNEVVYPFLHVIQTLTKRLWRMDFFTCPDTCDSKVPWHECQCTCDVSAMAGKSAREVLEDSGVLGTFFYDAELNLVDNVQTGEGDTISGFTTHESNDILTELLHVLCTPARIGTSYEASSTNDATFWVIHPTLDRLWHLSRMRDTPEFDETWDDHNTCTGHNSGDTQPFRTDLFLDAPRPPTPAQRSVALRRFQEGFSQGIDGIKSYYTNDDLYRMAKPDGEQLPYMYDNFNWEHCDAMGVHIR